MIARASLVTVGIDLVFASREMGERMRSTRRGRWTARLSIILDIVLTWR